MNLQNIDPANFVMCPYRYISRFDPCPGKSCQICEAGGYDPVGVDDELADSAKHIGAMPRGSEVR